MALLSVSVTAPVYKTLLLTLHLRMRKRISCDRNPHFPEELPNIFQASLSAHPALPNPRRLVERPVFGDQPLGTDFTGARRHQKHALQTPCRWFSGDVGLFGKRQKAISKQGKFDFGALVPLPVLQNKNFPF